MSRLSNEIFSNLMSLKKVFEDKEVILPFNNKNTTLNVKSKSTNDKFYLDIDRRGKLSFNKFKLQNRHTKIKIPLIRIDIDSPPHINPDGTRTSRNHIHIYKETDIETGNLPWAYDLNTFHKELFKKTSDFMQIFHDFCKYCNIENINVQDVM